MTVKLISTQFNTVQFKTVQFETVQFETAKLDTVKRMTAFEQLAPRLRATARQEHER